MAWFPLGPREVFVPGYHVSDEYVTRVNVTNTVVERTTIINVYHNNVTNVTYMNQHVNGGVTVVSHDTFVNARPVSRNVVAVPARELAAAPVSRTFSAAPVHASLVGEGRPATARPPATVLNRTVVTVRTPAPPPARFQEQQGGLCAPGAPANRPGNAPPAGFRPPPRPIEAHGEGPQGSGVNRNTDAAGNPFARPAPPVHEPTPEQQQSDAAKQSQYQQQHQQMHPEDAPARPADKPSGRDKKNS